MPSEIYNCHQEEIELLSEAPELQGWSEEALEALVGLYDEYRSIGRVYLDGELVGVGLCRPLELDNRAGREDRFVFQPQGDLLWISGVVVRGVFDPQARRDVLAELWLLMLQRHGRKLWIGYDRKKDGRPARIYPFNKIERRFIENVI